jgi:hypothetical protein
MNWISDLKYFVPLWLHAVFWVLILNLPWSFLQIVLIIMFPLVFLYSAIPYYRKRMGLLKTWGLMSVYLVIWAIGLSVKHV